MLFLLGVSKSQRWPRSNNSVHNSKAFALESGCSDLLWRQLNIFNENAFQWDAYGLLIDHGREGVYLTRGVPANGGYLSRGGVTCPGGTCPVVPAGGVSCDLSHHAFDVTCMLPPNQLSVSTSAAAYIVWPRCMLGYTPHEHNDRQVQKYYLAPNFVWER